jgi:lipoic acid synthetase
MNTETETYDLIQDSIKRFFTFVPMNEQHENYRQPKPEWLKVRLRRDQAYHDTSKVLHKHGLHTICTSGNCPNIKECWAAGTATFMILGDICTRACRFCNTKTGRPLPVDPDEPQRLAEAVASLKLKHAVITSVDRDDLPDLGAQHWADCIHAVQERNPSTSIEVLIPDFNGEHHLLDKVIAAKPQIIGHNLETVERLTPSIRSRAKYALSLNVLSYINQSGIIAKSGIMLGLGETPQEVRACMADIRATGCKVLTIGQYLRPTPKHHPVVAYVEPHVFDTYKQEALQLGFMAAECGPLVRSSYHAEQQIVF